MRPPARIARLKAWLRARLSREGWSWATQEEVEHVELPVDARPSGASDLRAELQLTNAWHPPAGAAKGEG